MADISNANDPRVTRHWPTYYTPMADLLHTLGRLITCRLDARCDTFRRHCGFAGRSWQPTRILATFGTDPVSAGRLMTRRGRLITRQPQLNLSSTSAQPQPGSGVGWLSIKVGIKVSWTLSIYPSIYQRTPVAPNSDTNYNGVRT